MRVSYGTSSGGPNAPAAAITFKAPNGRTYRLDSSNLAQIVDVTPPVDARQTAPGQVFKKGSQRYATIIGQMVAARLPVPRAVQRWVGIQPAGTVTVTHSSVASAVAAINDPNAPASSGLTTGIQSQDVPMPVVYPDTSTTSTSWLPWILGGLVVLGGGAALLEARKSKALPIVRTNGRRCHRRSRRNF